MNTHSLRARRPAGLFPALLVLAFSAPLPAAQTWVGTTGDWATSANWSSSVPSNEDATINNGGTAQIGSVANSIQTLNINSSSFVEVNSGGSIRVDANIENSGGTLTVNNGGTLTFTGNVLRNGSTVVNSGGTMNFGTPTDSSWGRVGNSGFGATSFAINGGTVNANYTEGDGLVLGDYEHTTTFSMTNGGTLNMANKGLKIGWWRAGAATFTMDASMVTFTQDGTLDIGAGDDSVAATGSLALQGGAVIVKTATANDGSFIIGSGWDPEGSNPKGNVGTLTVDGNSSIDWGRGEFIIGNGRYSTGTMTLTSGTVTTHSWTPVSRAGANGHLIINGGTMNVTGSVYGMLQVTTSDYGTGVVDINGGVLNVTASGGSIAYQHWGHSGESWGTINLNGGRLIAGNIYSSRASSLGHAVFNFNGGILQPNGGDLMHDIEFAYVKSGGAVIEFTGNNTTIRQALLDDGSGTGGLTVRGNGTFNVGGNDQNMLILPNYNNTFAGPVVVSQGAYVRLGDGDGNSGDGMLGASTGITLDFGGLKNNNSSEPVLGATRTITLAAGGGYVSVGWGDRKLTVLGKVTGPGALNVCRDGGSLVLSNPANDYQGDTVIGADSVSRWSDGWQSGLALGASEVIPDGPLAGNVVIDGEYGGHLNLNGHDETVNGLSDIKGGRLHNSGSAATLTVGPNNSTSSYHGTIEGPVALTKTGSGTLTLGSPAALTMTGEVRVAAGTLHLAGEHPGSGALRMNGGRLLLDQATHVTPQAGLVAGSFTDRRQMDSGTPNPSNLAVALGTPMLNNNTSGWSDNSEFLYSGAFHVSAAQAGDWTFAENIDDWTWLAIDGQVLIDNSAWNQPTRATISLTEGWHNIEVRAQNGGGGYGPSNQGWLTGNRGFVYKVGAGTDNPDDYSFLTDPGDGSVLRTSKNILIPNAVHLDAEAAIEVANDGHEWSFTGPIDGSNGLRKTGAGAVSLTGTLTFTGDLAIEEGTVTITHCTLADTSTVSILGGASLNLPNAGTDVVAALYLGGMPVAPGTYDWTNTGGAITGLGKLRVGAADSAYDAWADTFPTLSDRGFDVDFDHDGLANGLEWILGGNPTANDTGSVLPTATGNASGGLTIVFHRNPDSVAESTLVLEWDTDLDAFAHSVTVGASDTNVPPDGVHPSVDLDNPAANQITITIPAGNAVDGRVFARLKATQNP